MDYHIEKLRSSMEYQNQHKQTQKEPETKTPGRPVVLGDEVEKMLVDRLKLELSL